MEEEENIMDEAFMNIWFYIKTLGVHLKEEIPPPQECLGKNVIHIDQNRKKYNNLVKILIY